MTSQEIMSRFQPLMPQGVLFAASFPVLPYQDDDGDWHQFADDALIVRVSNNLRYVDGLCVESDLAWTDEMFRERILAPMLAILAAAVPSKVDGQ